MEAFINLYEVFGDYREFIKTIGHCKVTEDMGVIYNRFIKVLNREDIYKYDIHESVYVIRVEQFSPIPHTQVRLNEEGLYEYI